jgi:hypothetical protein
VNQGAAEVTDESEEPENQENNEDSPEHMFSFGLVSFSSRAEAQVRLSIFQFARFLPGAVNFFISRINDWRERGGNTKPNSMRSNILAGSLLAMLFAGGAVAGVVVEKRSRQVPDTAVLDCEGVHSFVFRGPTGTSRRPILVPPREYWTAHEAGLYSFVLRYSSGNVCSRMVTPEVFARYQVGEDFYDREQALRESDDSKTIQPAVHHRHRTAQVRHRSHARGSHRALAKHRRHHRTHRLAQR